MERKPGKILTINSGSSSIKFALFTAGEPFKKELYGKIERIGFKDTSLSYQDAVTGKEVRKYVTVSSPAQFLIDWLGEHADLSNLAGIGHRVVHGLKHTEPELITEELLQELSRIANYDPDHLPQEIEIIEIFRKHFPELTQLACFDTSFHTTMPIRAKLLPLPRRYFNMGIQRYGFHGLSYAYIMEELTRISGKEIAMGKIIVAHLGNGASLAAIKNGVSIDTSMGFTPASGLVMSSRTGDIDPGVAWFLMQSEKMNAEQFSKLIHHQSGLLGMSETSSDMQDLLDLQVKDFRAAEAIELFCYQAKKWIGAFAAALEGLDTLVFTGGIGEHAPEIRSRICKGLQFIGVDLDEIKNTNDDAVISTEKSRVIAHVIPANEELMIARSVDRSLNNVDKK
ncbi:MAG: acetate/propionate family kinase [Flavitalea sp.]